MGDSFASPWRHLGCGTTTHGTAERGCGWSGIDIFRDALA